MTLFKCKMCGGDLEIAEGSSVAVCEYCGSKQTLPRLDDDKKANLYDRANHFRRNNEFDKAIGIYENILNEDNTDAEAYWSLVLCRYGIEYVEDPATRKRVPTVNRAQFTSVFDDEDYKSALQYATAEQRGVYEAEAAAINEIQKGILEISNKEEPFDVFICYKETDAQGRRTPDSVLATELYHELTKEGFKAFFSRITLEDKLGVAYEPYIFAALNSAKVMVVVGTKPEYFSAVWVKNVWSRYLALIKNGAKKMLIPAYRDMDPYDLPEEFSHLQAQDMSKLGFMQDLIRGIKKIIVPEEKVASISTMNQTAPTVNAGVASLLKRAFMFLEDGEWASANDYCEKVLDIDPECAEAYLGKLMVELQVPKRDDLLEQAEPFDNRNFYQKALRFADEKLSEELNGYIVSINERNKTNANNLIYTEAEKVFSTATTEYDFKQAAELFRKIPGWKDADARAKEATEKADVFRNDAIYNNALNLMEDTHTIFCEYDEDGFSNTVIREKDVGERTYLYAAELFRSIAGWKDAEAKAKEATEKAETSKKDLIYARAANAFHVNTEQECLHAAELFRSISGWKDASEKANECLEQAEICRKNEIYDKAQHLTNWASSEKYASAIELLETIPHWKDTDEKITKLRRELDQLLKKEAESANNKRKVELLRADYGKEYSALISERDQITSQLFMVNNAIVRTSSGREKLGVLTQALWILGFVLAGAGGYAITLDPIPWAFIVAFFGVVMLGFAIRSTIITGKKNSESAKECRKLEKEEATLTKKLEMMPPIPTLEEYLKGHNAPEV